MRQERGVCSPILAIQNLTGMVSTHVPVNALLRDLLLLPLAVSLGFILTAPQPALAQGNAWIGFYTYPLSPEEMRSLQVGNAAGPVITGLLPESPAALAELQPGDGLLEIDGQKIATIEAAGEALAKRSAGDEIEIVYLRQGVQNRVRLKAVSAPANLNAQLFELASGGAAWAQYLIATKYFNGDGTRADATKARYWFQLAAESGVAMAQVAMAEANLKGLGGDQSAEHARAWYGRAAEQGLLAAQLGLAKMANGGEGGNVDLALAVHWYTAAAEQGSAEAHYWLGFMCLSGRGVAKDSQLGIEHLTQAAQAGHTSAMAELGNHYASGGIVARNYSTAVSWLMPAAQAGVARAQHDLGALYYYGHGVPRDQAAAAQWFNAAAVQGNIPSQALLGMMYLHTSPPDYPQAVKWLTRAAENGNPQAATGLASLYATGNGLQKDPKKAFALYHQAAQQGYLEGMYRVGAMISDGIGVDSDQAVALQWLERVGKQKPDERDTLTQGIIGKAQVLMGVIYQTGAGNVAKNDALAFYWIGQAAGNKELPAQRIYGQMLRDRKQYAQAIPWLREAATRGDRAAQNDLGVMYHHGWGVAKSRADAIAWLLRAYQQGSPTAKDTLQKMGVDAK